jgi:Tol biopolymer transport system component/type IV secretory pathway TrbD component
VPDDRDDAAFAPTALDTGNATAADSSNAGESQDARPRLAVGEQLGDRYEVLGFLGEGGMGAVYRAFDRVLDEEVALKVVRGGLADQSELRDEVRMAQKVTHPSVCRIYDLEDLGGRHFVKMELVTGETLAARIASRGALPIVSVIAIGRAIADGLAAAHAHGIVHRDLKPGNVMMRGDRAVLMDFGLARRVADGADERAGTPGYMSPEQLAGTGVDERSDLYALGCLVFEMLTGKRLFERGSSMTELATRQARTPVPDVRARRPGTPRWLARAVNLLLSLDPDDRPRGARLLVGGPRSLKFVLGIAAAAVVAGVTAWWLTRAGPSWRPELEELGPRYEGETARRPSLSAGGILAYAATREPWGTYQLYVGPMDGSSPKRLAIEATGSIGHVRWTRDGRGWLLALDERIVVRGAASPQIVDRARGRDPDDCGDAIVTVARVANVDADELVITDASGVRSLVTTKPGDHLDHPRCDPSGRRIVYTHRIDGPSNVFIVDRNGKVEQLTDAGDDHTPTFTPGGTSIVFARGELRHALLYELDLETRELEQLTFGLGPDLAPEVSRDGARLVFNREVISTAVFVGGSNEPPRQLGTPEQYLYYAEPTPDLRRIVGPSDSPPDAIVSIDTETGDQQQIATGNHPFVSRDGQRVFFVPVDKPRELHAVPIAGGSAAVRVAELPGEITDGIDTVDGQHVAVQAGRATQSWRIDATRTPVPDREPGLVIPAPSGSWRAVVDDGVARLRAPQRAERSLPCTGILTWVDERTVGCAIDDDRERHNTIAMLDVETGERRDITLPWDAQAIVLARDGKRWVATRRARPVTRMVITNFADRPWAP